MSILTTLVNIQRERTEALETWFSDQRKIAPPHLTSSVDMRHSGLRLAPVDVNIYPAGFQNLSQHGKERAAIHFGSGIKSILPNAKKLLIVPENHTRNLPYIENLNSLQEILGLSGFEVEVGSLIAPSNQPIILETQAGKQIVKQPLRAKNNLLQTESGFVPDVIVMNNDGTAGIPELLKNLAQPILPAAEFGWFQRKKSCHFKQYEILATEFATAFNLDPWLIAAYLDCARNINFKDRSGVDELARKVDTLAAKIKIKHAEYGISDAPYIYVKADSGTYGMGIMMVHDGSELLEMNKKQRNKMHVIKDGAEVHDVILQEGIKTVDLVDGKPAEPMVYLVDGVPVGGMFRVNSQRDAYGNLNASGMEYIGMCDENETSKDAHQVAGCDFSAYGMISAISALAAGKEGYGIGTHCADLKQQYYA